jgi:hypothetical protein
MSTACGTRASFGRSCDDLFNFSLNRPVVGGRDGAVGEEGEQEAHAANIAGSDKRCVSDADGLSGTTVALRCTNKSSGV